MSINIKVHQLIQRTGMLYNLFERYFPDHRSKQNVLNVPGLAHDMGYAQETLHKCLRKNEIKVPVALQILRFSHDETPEQPLYWQDLLPYVLPEYERYSRPQPKTKPAD